MKKTYLSRCDKKIAGVCGGIASYLGVDSTIVRLAMVFFTFIFAGTPLIFYLAAWILIPDEPEHRTIDMEK